MFIHNFIKNQNTNFYFLKVVIFCLNLRKIFSNDQKVIKTSSVASNQSSKDLAWNVHISKK